MSQVLEPVMDDNMRGPVALVQWLKQFSTKKVLRICATDVIAP